ncbi:SRPBCC family protein [Gordonia rubripertincta]|uniref:SRPBCC family protein n=1 Tax=Gordonia rubripertincta TaxID=36822 RepID=UPI0015F97B6A|nr:SRPBCC family protein [Gordonia rubripertincta]QMU19432.1 SRPBCC family protein [Gordonia rubripertincta]
MKLENTVTIAAPPSEVFTLINDVERVATCVPGATLTGRDGDAYTGGVKVKVGPIAAAYQGTLRFVEIDETNHTLVMEGSGADSHGNGGAQASVRLAVVPDGTGSQLRVDTDVLLSGKIVAFGKSAIVAVSNKIMMQFADNVSALLTGPAPAAATPAATVQPGLPAAAAPAPVGAPQAAASGSGDLDMMALLPAGTAKALTYAGIFVAGIAEGLLIARAFGRR